MERTLIIIKPDAIERGLAGRILSRFEDKYFRICGMLMDQKSEEWVKRFYPHLSGEVLENMAKFMSSTPIIGVVLAGDRVVNFAHEMVGNFDYPGQGTIRGDFGGAGTRFNCVHSSDSEASAEREIALFFGENNVTN